jgi:hypothetical protein
VTFFVLTFRIFYSPPNKHTCNDTVREQVLEVFLTYDTVHWIPTTGPLSRFITKCHTPLLLLQFVSQCSAQELIYSSQDSPYQGFSRSEFLVRCLWIRLDS